MKVKSSKQFYGEDKDAINKLLEFGENIKKQGGIFETSVDGNIKSIT